MIIAIKAARQVTSRTLIDQIFKKFCPHLSWKLRHLKFERELGICFLLLESLP